MMASSLDVVICALCALAFYTGVGWPLSRLLTTAGRSILAFAPALGWAVHSALSLPVLMLTGFTSGSVVLVSAAALLASWATTLARTTSGPELSPATKSVPLWTYGAAALVAVAAAAAIMPKFVADGVILAAPIFDHSKAALVDEIARLGLPPTNPFYGEADRPALLAYYYLWHFSAAQFALAPGISGWEADIALTWFTAFASLTLMMGLAVRMSGRSDAAIWVAVMSLGASLRPVMEIGLGRAAVDQALSDYAGLGAWIVQAAWVPQHLASATCVVLACLLIARLASGGGRLIVPVLALVVTAGYQSSVWVGGVTFAPAAAASGAVLLVLAPPGQRLAFGAKAAVAALFAAILCFPFLRDQFMAAAAREDGAGIALWPYDVLGAAVPAGLRRALDLPAYWLVRLPMDFPAIYFAGSAALVGAVMARGGTREERMTLAGLASLVAVSFAVAWLFASTIANNDLGWRAVLPGVLALTAFAASGLSRWLSVPRPTLASAALVLVALALPDGAKRVREGLTGSPNPAAVAFAQSPELWQAVRRYAGADERIANNPLYLKEMTPWPVNISWALLSDRRSCFAGWELGRAYIPLPLPQVDAVDDRFIRVFAGQGSEDDVRELATRYGCRVAVVAPGDGAWTDDPFAPSPHYRLVEMRPGRWRIYIATAPRSDRPGE